MKRRLKVNLLDLEMSFENTDSEFTYDLDLESGEVLQVTSEMRSEFEAALEDAEEEGIEFEAAVARSDMPPWMKELMPVVAAVDERFGTTIVGVPDADSREGFQDMEDFATSLQDGVLKNRLFAGLSGRRPFRRFKDALEDREVRERWFAFHDARLRERVLEWLEEEEIELIEE